MPSTKPCFDAALAAHELPCATLLELWQRTRAAHQNLCEVWIEGVTRKVSSQLAEDIANEAWPRRLRGASWKQLFFDDLRFVIAATKLKPDMLTIAEMNQANVAPELEQLGGCFRTLATFSKHIQRDMTGSKQLPDWVGAPNRLRARLRGKGIQKGFGFLYWLWRMTESSTSYALDIEAFEDRLSSCDDAKALALLWNYAAITYMFATDRWYAHLEKHAGTQAAQEVEKLVWLDLGAAEYDLDIGLQALGVEGNDVESLLRGFQFAPGEVGILNVDFELRSKEHGILTHKTCPAIDRFEHFDQSRLEHCCEICILGMPISGEMLGKNIKCKALKLPPRNHSNDIACQWEYRLEEA